MHCLFFFNDTATTEIYTLSLHDALPIFTESLLEAPLEPPAEREQRRLPLPPRVNTLDRRVMQRSEEHTSELQSRQYLVCRLLLEKKTHRVLILRVGFCANLDATLRSRGY